MCLPSGFQGSVRNLALHRREMVKGLIIERRRRLRKDPDKANRWHFNHGLGDALMLRSILPAIKHPIVLGVPKGKGYSEIFEGADEVILEEADDAGEKYYRIKFPAEDCCLPLDGGRPVKPRFCLEYDFEVIDPTFRIRPLELDLSDCVHPGIPKAKSMIHHYGANYVVFHGQGASSPWRKDCPEEIAEVICKSIVERGYRVVVIQPDSLGYDFIDEKDILSTEGLPSGAACLWHVLKGASAFVGIDSGPLHMALAIPDLDCMFVKNKIDFMRFFYDAGLERIREILTVDSTQNETNQTIRRFLCSKKL